MVGIMQAYNYKPDDSMKLIDQLNQIGNNFSISTSDLAKGLQISGSALEVGGNNIEQSMALITAYNSSIHNKYPLGVCIRKDIHDLFHQLYGSGGNTEEQWESFIAKYSNKLTA